MNLLHMGLSSLEALSSTNEHMGENNTLVCVEVFCVFSLPCVWLAAGGFGHDEHFDRLAELNRSLDGGLWWWDAVDAVAPPLLGS